MNLVLVSKSGGGPINSVALPSALSLPMPFAIADIIVTAVAAIIISGTRCAALYWGAGLRNNLCWDFVKEGGGLLAMVVGLFS